MTTKFHRQEEPQSSICSCSLSKTDWTILTGTKSASKRTSMPPATNWKNSLRKNTRCKISCTTKRKCFRSGRASTSIRSTHSMPRYSSMAWRQHRWKNSCKRRRAKSVRLKGPGTHSRCSLWKSKRSTKNSRRSSKRYRVKYKLLWTHRRRIRCRRSKKFSLWERLRGWYRITRRRKGLMDSDLVWFIIIINKDEFWYSQLTDPNDWWWKCSLLRRICSWLALSSLQAPKSGYFVKENKARWDSWKAEPSSRRLHLLHWSQQGINHLLVVISFRSQRNLVTKNPIC